MRPGTGKVLAEELSTPFSANKNENSRDSNSSLSSSEIWRMGVDHYQHCKSLVVKFNKIVTFKIRKKLIKNISLMLMLIKITKFLESFYPYHLS